MPETSLIDLHRLELMTGMLQLSQENPECSWLQAAVIMNLPLYRLESASDGQAGVMQFDAQRN